MGLHGWQTGTVHFNPRSSGEERRRPLICFGAYRHFNPRSSGEERLDRYSAVEEGTENFNPRSSGEERLCRNRSLFNTGISIHAPRVRSDFPLSDAQHDEFISIHAPRVRSD